MWTLSPHLFTVNKFYLNMLVNWLKLSSIHDHYTHVLHVSLKIEDTTGYSEYASTYSESYRIIKDGQKFIIKFNQSYK